jgi:predicted phage terminase large subunit-like protein
MEYPDLLATTKSLYYELSPDEIAIEEKSSGIQLIQSMVAETGIDVQRIKPSESKWERARAISPIQKAGKCYLPQDISWAYDFIEEHSSFPGKFTDQVDTTAHALLWLRPIDGDVDSSSAETGEITQRFKGAVGSYGRIETPEAASFDWVATKGGGGSRWKKFSSRRPGELPELDVDDYSGGY